LWEHDASYPCAPGDPPGRRVVVGAGRPAVRSDAHRDVDVRGVRVRPRVASAALRAERLRPDAAVENHVLDRAMIRLLEMLGEVGEGQALIAEDIDRAHHTGAVRVVVRPARGMRLVSDDTTRRPRIHRPDLIPERLQGPREPPCHYDPSPCCSSASSRAVSASICACWAWSTGTSAAVNRSYEIAAGRPSSSYCTKSPRPISSSSSAINPTCRMSSSGDSMTSPARHSPSPCCSCIQSGHCATCGLGSHDRGRICITAAGSISRSVMSRLALRVEEIAVYVTCPVEVSMRSSAFPAPGAGVMKNPPGAATFTGPFGPEIRTSSLPYSHSSSSERISMSASSVVWNRIVDPAPYARTSRVPSWLCLATKMSCPVPSACTRSPVAEYSPATIRPPKRTAVVPDG